MPSASEVPEALAAEVLAGRVVAFVGAGFSMPRAPSWHDLLQRLARTLPDDGGRSAEVREEVLSLDQGSAARDFEAAAQQIRDVMDEAAFFERIKAILRDARPEPGEADSVSRRIEWLTGIPFRAVLTTNFDGYIPRAQPPSTEVYSKLLRGDRSWWHGDWNVRPPERPVIALHGSIGFPRPSVVFTRRDYLELVHGRHDYRPFLRALLMTNTVLFLGFSFTDAYINELRSEVQTLLEPRLSEDAPPLAYAALPDISDATAAYLRRHERIEVLPLRGGEQVGDDFDELLRQLHARTNPQRRLARLLEGKRIAWIDPFPANNGYGFEVLERAIGSSTDKGGIEKIYDTNQWARQLKSGPPPDVIITHWGHGQADGMPRALEVLTRLRAEPESLPEAPVIVFASGSFARENTEEALRRGAVAYHWTWAGLFREFERILSPVDA